MPIFQKTKRYGDSAKCDAEGMLCNLGAQFGFFVRKKLISTTPPGQFLWMIPKHGRQVLH